MHVQSSSWVHLIGNFIYFYHTVLTPYRQHGPLLYRRTHLFNQNEHHTTPLIFNAKTQHHYKLTEWGLLDIYPKKVLYYTSDFHCHYQSTECNWGPIISIIITNGVWPPLIFYQKWRHITGLIFKAKTHNRYQSTKSGSPWYLTKKRHHTTLLSPYVNTPFSLIGI